MTRRTALLIAFHFPPLRGVSGVQRTLCFAKYLPQFGWDPIVLTAPRSAYRLVAATDPEDPEFPFEVRRPHAFDVANVFRAFRRYPRRLALPDRWANWNLFANRAASRIIRERRIDIVWSTFPVATTHLIGMNIAKRHGIPWVAEFRDPMWQGDFPPDPDQNRCWKKLEEQVFANATRVVVVTPGAADEYSSRFPESSGKNLVVIENGYDEPEFARAENHLTTSSRTSASTDRMTLLHSGVIYPEERDPSQLFVAISMLKRRTPATAARLRLLLRATGADQRYAEMIAALRIGDVVELAPPIDYTSAITEMLTVDGLLILQAANCNTQIPAKLYEYLRAGRPIIALTDPDGDTGRMLRGLGTGLVARLDSATEIEAALCEFLFRHEGNNWTYPEADTLRRYARESQTGELAEVFEDVVGRC